MAKKIGLETLFKRLYKDELVFFAKEYDLPTGEVKKRYSKGLYQRFHFKNSFLFVLELMNSEKS